MSCLFSREGLVTLANPIQTIRAAVVNDLGTYKVFTEWPETFTPPALVVVEADPFITPGNRLGTYKANFEVFLFVRDGSNKVMTESLDDLVVGCLNALRTPASGDGWNIGDIAQPELVAIGGSQFYATQITINKSFGGK